MTLIHAYQGRGITRRIIINDAAGDAITPGVHDKVRATISREGETAKLIVDSDAPTVNGSSLTKGASNTLRLDASDLEFEPGVYTLFLDYFDNADAAEWKCVEKQVFHLEGT